MTRLAFGDIEVPVYVHDELLRLREELSGAVQPDTIEDALVYALTAWAENRIEQRHRPDSFRGPA